MREPTEEEMNEMERLFLRSMTIPRAMAIRQHESAVYASIVEYQQVTRNAQTGRAQASTAQTSNSQTDAGQTHASQANGVPAIEIQDYDAAQVANTQIDQGQPNEGNVNRVATMEVDNDSLNQIEDNDCMEIDPPQRVRPIHYLQLSPLDHTASRGYLHVYLCFPFGGDEDMAYAAYQHLGAAYRFALSPWPFLAGEVINSDPQDPGILQVKYHSSVEAEDVDRCMGKKVIFGELDWTYEQLTRWGAPPEWFGKAFGSFPADSNDSSDGCPASAMRLTYVRGGLIVGFAFHRAVVDGCSTRQFLHAFAAGTIKGKKHWRFDLSNRVQDRYKMLDFFLPKKGYSESDFVKGKGKTLSKGYNPLHHCEEYDMTPFPEPTAPPEPTTPPVPAAPEPILVGGKIFIPDVPDNYDPRNDTLPPKPYTQAVLEFKNVTVRQLHSRVKYFLEEIDSPYEVSRVECFCGLLWVAIMRTRAHRLSKDTVVRFTTAVDARNRVGRAVKEDWLPLWYMGNFSVAAVAKTTLGNLIGDEEHRALSMTENRRKPMWQPKIHEVLGIRNDISIEAVANAAVLIRRSIDAVNADYVKHRLAITLDDATHIRDTHARDRAADSADTGVDFSSWNNWLWGSLGRADELLEMEEENNRRKLNGTMRFEIPGVKKQAFPDFARTSALEAEGACVLLPRWNPGGATNAPWEVALHLRHEEMKQLRWVTELGGWTARVYDRDVGEIVEENKNTVLAAESNGEFMRKDLERYWREKQIRFWYFRVGERVFPKWHADWERRKAGKEAEREEKKRKEAEAKAQAKVRLAMEKLLVVSLQTVRVRMIRARMVRERMVRLAMIRPNMLRLVVVVIVVAVAGAVGLQLDVPQPSVPRLHANRLLVQQLHVVPSNVPRLHVLRLVELHVAGLRKLRQDMLRLEMPRLEARSLETPRLEARSLETPRLETLRLQALKLPRLQMRRVEILRPERLRLDFAAASASRWCISVTGPSW
ncbi:hypothetical protein GE09DRAFT_1215287 [Coniochaeta sp. 2T2.1]|nr:hypothetical protein GE09DRAFT_1215287 [Coniochaeta sp. 2T2.1]